MDAVTYWNDVDHKCNQVTHTQLDKSEAGSQGPVGRSRSFAIVHLAMHDAYFGIVPAAHGTYHGGLPVPKPGASAEAAIAAAAHTTLSKLYPTQKEVP